MQQQSPDRERTHNLPLYRNIEDFYNARPIELRRGSGEADYGVHWHCPPWPHRWRVSYVRTTGEIYAVQQGNQDGPVLVLGVLPPDPVADERNQTYYRTLDRVLEGWPEACNKDQNGISWILNRLQACPAYRKGEAQ